MPTLEDGSFLTKAPITPNEVKRRYSKGLDFEVVFKKGYRNNGMCASIQSQNKKNHPDDSQNRLTIQKQAPGLIVTGNTL